MVVAVVLLSLFACQLARVALAFSATWDEPHHLLDGYTVATRNDHRLNPEVPPLLKVAAALPLLGERLQVPPNHGRPEPEEAFRDGRTFVFANGPDRTLLPARAVCALFAVTLAALTAAAAWRLFGATAGLAALALITLDPTLLANGPLVTTDTASALFIFAAVLAFFRSGRAPRADAWLAAAGGLTGCALATKFTGVLLSPVLVLLAVWDGAVARSAPLAGRRLMHAGVVLLIAWGVVWAAYGFQYAASAAGPPLQPTLDAYLHTLPRRSDERLLAFAAHWRLVPEGYLWGLANTKLTESADTAYLFGHVYRHGPSWYFAAAFLIKSTLPLLLLLVAAAVLGRRLGASARVLGLLLIPPALYFAVVSGSHFDIGVRHLLPVYPFLYVLAGAAAGALAVRGRRGALVAALLVGWQAATCLLTWPAWMAYANEAWGGPAQTHRFLSDANVDWGQQLKAARAYLDARGENGRCWIAYFPDGAVEPSDYGVNCRRLPTTETLWWLKSPMDVPPVVNGPVLISASDLASFEFGPGELNPYAGFTRHGAGPTAAARAPDRRLRGGPARRLRLRRRLQHGLRPPRGRTPGPLRRQPRAGVSRTSLNLIFSERSQLPLLARSGAGAAALSV